MKRILKSIVVLLAGVLLLAACGAAATAPSAAMEESQAEERQAAPQAEAKEAPAAERAPAAKAEAPASRSQSSQSTSSQPAVRPPQQTAGATTFKDYPRATFVNTVRDAVATFSLDTDRTSFHLALNWARAAYRVEPDSVRAEEWINAFNYDYALPLRDDSFAIATDVIRHPLDSGLHLARIAFQAADLAYDDTPLNVTLVLDASGSMREGDRVAIAREAAESIRRSLRGQDRIAVVHFTTRVLDNLTVDHREPDDRAVRRSIDLLEPHGSTNVQAGLDLGVQLADRIRRERPEAYNYIILMSDGVANVDATDPFSILESAEDRDDTNPLRLITIGVGIENYNDYLLEQLAQHGNGWYRYLSTVEQARATFSRENWLALSIPFADQTRAQVTWDPDMVAVWRIVGYENRVTSDESFTEARKEFAEIPAGAATTVFFELQLTDAGRRDTARLGEVEIRWVTPSSGESNRQHATLLSTSDALENARAAAFLQFGSIVALAADRYSNLDFAESPVDRDLAILLDELWSLDRQLGDLTSYKDFSYLLDYLTQTAQKERPDSGYSR
ncbi:MAG: von Willebrand factor type A domain-containing protein [Chloroflexi bacterium]|nr:von Willebrand factor type A domain-containing protein [Chloroflexota bacterium]